ncbi:MAG: helix-turn-helix transcriptional regulator [Saprospiraceae bacterium]|nr:helix-turn-helix transcriptional regulator [Saprospiraceae bacterium]
MDFSLSVITDLLRLIVVIHSSILISLLFKSRNRDRHVITGVWLTASLIGYLLVDWDALPRNGVFYFFLIGAFSLPFCFWLFSKSLFDDHFTFQRRYLWIWFGVLLIQYSCGLISLPERFAGLLDLLPQLVSLVFVVLAIVEALKNAEADLLANRARFRTVFIVTTAVLIALTLFSEIIYRNQTVPLELEFAQKILIAGIVFYFSLSRLEFKTGFFKEKEKETALPEEIDEALLIRLLYVIEKEKIYHTEGLTIRQLAEHLDVKEYKLRQLINQHLGFRNFNDFLHSYRIQEACDTLANPAQKHLTVLEIAYQIGYQSLAPFNKAFRDIVGTTPTAYRKEKLGK